MSSEICPFEPVVLRAVRAGFVDTDVRDHAGSCSDCGELLMLAGLLDADRREAMAEASLPPAGALWFQMKLRAAREAQVRSTLSARLIQGASLIGALVIALAAFGVPVMPDVAALTPALLTPWTLVTLGAAALFALVAPVAVWLALARSGS